MMENPKRNLREFMLECKLYPYSREHYEIFKECSELKVMELFLNNQKFLLEEAMYKNHGTGTLALTEGFLFESVNSSTLQSLQENFEVKFESVSMKIKLGIHKAMQAFKIFLQKLIGKYDPVTREAQSLLGKLKGHSLTDDDMAKIRKTVTAAEAKSGLKFRNNQPFTKKLPTLKGEDGARIRDLLAVALSDDTVVIDVPVDGDKVGALDPASIIKALETILVEDSSTSSVLAASKTMIAEWSSAKVNGLTINIDTPKMEKTAKILQKVLDRMATKKSEWDARSTARDAVIQKGKDIIDHSGVADKVKEVVSGKSKAKPATESVSTTAGDVGGAFAKASAALYASLRSCVQQSMDLYTKLLGYRTDVISGLKNVLLGVSMPETTPAATETPSAPAAATKTESVELVTESTDETEEFYYIEHNGTVFDLVNGVKYKVESVEDEIPMSEAELSHFHLLEDSPDKLFEGFGSKIKKGLKKAGKGMKKAAEEVGGAVEDGAKAVGKGAKKVGKGVTKPFKGDGESKAMKKYRALTDDVVDDVAKKVLK